MIANSVPPIQPVVSNQWTGLLDWTTGLTFDHKNAFTERSVGHEIAPKCQLEEQRVYIGSGVSSCQDITCLVARYPCTVAMQVACPLLPRSYKWLLTDFLTE